jgi:hypothetical protein
VIYEYQQPVADALKRALRVHAVCNELDLPVRPRNHRLVIGPTGSGKSHIAEAVAKDMGWEVYMLNASTWNPMGAKGEPTWDKITKWLSNLHEDARPVIILDELDKVSGEESWSRYIRAEMFNLLDGRTPGPGFCIEEEEGDADKIHETSTKVDGMIKTLLVIGCGAFQHVFDSPKHMGFAEQPSDELTQSKLSKSLQRELVNRFSQEILVLPEPGERDYRRMLEMVAEKLPTYLSQEVMSNCDKKIEAALIDKPSARFVEAVLSKALEDTLDLAPIYAPAPYYPSVEELYDMALPQEPTCSLDFDPGEF